MEKMMIGDHIKLIRGTLTKKDFALKIGASDTNVLAWEKGEALPGSKYLKEIHRVFGVDVNWLLTGEGKPYMGRDDEDMIPSFSIQEEGAEYNRGNYADPFAEAVSGLKEIYDSRDPILIPAIDANIRAFRIAARREKQIYDQTAEIKALRSECEELKKRLATLEDKYKLLAPQPVPDEAAA
jgi:transcriptional regulator with XRE-family HTH domain